MKPSFYFIEDIWEETRSSMGEDRCQAGNLPCGNPRKAEAKGRRRCRSGNPTRGNSGKERSWVEGKVASGSLPQVVNGLRRWQPEVGIDTWTRARALSAPAERGGF